MQIKKQNKKNKYNARKAKHTVDGKTYYFDSEAEKKYFKILYERWKNKEIVKLSQQPSFVLTNKCVVNCFHTKKKLSTVSEIKYTADFRYFEDGKMIVVEVKGKLTEGYGIRKRLFNKACHDKKEGFEDIAEYHVIFRDKKEEFYFDD